MIDLSPDQNFFTFEFAALDFSKPDRVTYEYKLEGLDQDWVSSNGQRTANYTHVPPGTYTFQVRATNSDGVRSANTASVRVRVAPPCWRAWWFLIAAGAGLAGVGTVIYRNRVQRLLELERLRVRIASDLHDDVGSSLSKIALYSELVKEEVAPEDRDHYLTNIASTSRELVTTMSELPASCARTESGQRCVLQSSAPVGSFERPSWPPTVTAVSN